MSTLQDAPVEGTTNSNMDESLIHAFCPTCDPKGFVGLCGTELIGENFGTDCEIGCMVCALISICPRCGQDFAGHELEEGV